MKPRISAGEFGFKLNFITGYDATGYSSVVVKIAQPDGTILTKGASTTDASVGDWYYVVESTVFEDSGTYIFQLVENFTGKTLKSLPIPYRVGASL